MYRMRLHELLSMNSPGSPATNAFAAKTPRIGSIVDLLETEGSYKLLVMALKGTGLDERLRSAGPYTVFAPTDSAFQRVPLLAELLKDTDRLRAILMRHLVWGYLDTCALLNIEILAPLDGEALRIAIRTFRIEDAEVVQPNL